MGVGRRCDAPQVRRAARSLWLARTLIGRIQGSDLSGAQRVDGRRRARSRLRLAAHVYSRYRTVDSELVRCSIDARKRQRTSASSAPEQRATAAAVSRLLPMVTTRGHVETASCLDGGGEQPATQRSLHSGLDAAQRRPRYEREEEARSCSGRRVTPAALFGERARRIAPHSRPCTRPGSLAQAGAR